MVHRDEIEFREKQSKENVEYVDQDEKKNESSCATTSKGTVKSYRRTQSENLNRKKCKQLRKSGSEKHIKHGGSGEKTVKSSYPEDGLSSEQFRGTVEAFIARQKALLREEEEEEHSREEDLKRAVEELNGIVIDGRKISVSPARFKDERSRSRVLLSSSNNDAGQINAESSKSRDRVNINRRGMSREIFEMHIPTDSANWVKRSLTGIIKYSFQVELIRTALLKEGHDVQIARWGYVWNSCVIVLKSHEEMLELWSKKEEVLKQWFERVEPLLNEAGVPMAFCMAELKGVPLLCWNEPFFEKLAGRWGSVVDIHDNTRKREDLTMARILLKVESPFDVPEVITLGSYGRSYKIVVSHGEGETCAEGENRLSVDNWIDQGVFRVSGGASEDRQLARLSLDRKDSKCGLSESQTVGKFKVGEYAGKSRGVSKVLESSPIVEKPFSVEIDPEEEIKTIGTGRGKEDTAENIAEGSLDPYLDNGYGGGSVGREIEGYFSEGDCLKSKSGLLIRRKRRTKRILYREALDQVSIDTASSSAFSILLKEAVETWEVSKLLGVSFKEGKEAFLDKIIALEKGLVICSWNVRGLGKNEKKRAVQNLVSNFNPTFLWLQETKTEKFRKSFFRRSGINKLKGILESPSVGSAGGLLCCWDDNVFELENQFVSRRFIATFGKLRSIDSGCGFINVYGPAVEEEKSGFFEELSSFLSGQTYPICVGGDFNVYLQEDEKLGRGQSRSSMEIFNEFILHTGLIDLPLNGELFPGVVQSLLPRSLSDHNAIVLENKGVDWGRKPFRLFNYLMDEEGFEDLKWSGNREKYPGALISELEKKISLIEDDIQQKQGTVDSEVLIELKNLRAELWMLHKIQEQIWFQYSRTNWIVDGDRNTKYFHTCATIRNKRNALLALNFKGETVEDPTAIKAIVKEYFFKIYNERTTLEIDDLNLDFPRIFLEQKQFLEQEFSEEEVWEVVKSCGSNKAPGPDGFNLGFFKRFWQFLKILSKCLSRRLRSCISDLISPSQFAFIPGRQILDCSLIANEGIDFWRKNGLKGCVFKADFKKAYDTLDWPILFRIMKEMGFGSRWIGWISKCVTSATVSVLVNGVPTEEITMRGVFGRAVPCLHCCQFSWGTIESINSEGCFTRAFFGTDLECKEGSRVFEIISGLQLNLKKCPHRNSNILWDPVVQSFNKSFSLQDSKFYHVKFLWGGGDGRKKIHWFDSKVSPKLSWMWRDMVRNHYNADSLGCSIRVNKEGRLSQFGEFSSGGWIWNVQLRRELNDWEFEQWANLMVVISDFSISADATDGLFWKGNGEGVFTVKSCVNLSYSGSPDSEEAKFWKYNVWRSVFHADAKRFLLAWNDLKTNSLIWPFIPGAVLWTIWKTRNFIVFEGGKLDRAEIFFLASGFLLIPFLSGFNRVSLVPSSKGFVKLNVDAATSSDWKRSGLGGILKDMSSSILGSFKEPAGPGPPTLMELKAILKGLDFFESIRHRVKDRLIIESDSQVAVGWIKDVVSCPVVYVQIVKDIIQKLSVFEGFISWVSRTANIEADVLAKAGIG
ncbi:hypothetical protein F3Y22_tig00009942pilonHSYRG00021 [Hibiscus syriacus]|uniref:Reverse transcriptase domain-containing protein n=1 Tax=Hibiscus syriacus TaxID=106335 RepID=A0A6A3CAW8_HIBSY|nr:hypothetical protein F3Y22_tig00009942pilonHSYRG00021 [Hibiscus syriacus]